MRSLIGLLWALGGAVAGFIGGAIVAAVISSATNASNREGAQGYFAIALGLIGAVIGVIVGLLLYARTAPSGQGAAFIGSGTTGLVALIAAIAISLWAFMNLREAPLKYDNSMANLEMEFRVLTTALPADVEGPWLDVEVQTAKTRPQGTVSWDRKRIDGAYTVIPVIEGPLYRAGSRFIAVRIEGAHNEMFNPPMKRTPNPKADWSEWYKPASVDAPYGVVPSTPLKGMLEMRYRVRVYGDPD